MRNRFTRTQLLSGLSAGAGSLALAACGAGATPSAATKKSTRAQ